LVRHFSKSQIADRYSPQKIPHAYPILNPRTAFLPFLLDDSFWYPIAIEALSSSVDISIWAGKNVAGLVLAELMARS
jgi:hypothetical protein